MASAGSLKHRVLLGIKGMPAHLWGLSSAERILGSSCASIEPAPATVAAWCVHPSFIPQEKLIGIPVSETPFVVVPPLYPREHEVIHSELTVLRYRVRIHIIEVQDWTSRPPPYDDEALGDSGNDPDWGFGGGRSGPWPRRHRFNNGDDGAGEDAAPDPVLGRGWGPLSERLPV